MNVSIVVCPVIEKIPTHEAFGEKIVHRALQVV